MARDKRIKLLLASRERYYQYIKDFEHSAEETAKYQKLIEAINDRLSKIQPRNPPVHIHVQQAMFNQKP